MSAPSIPSLQIYQVIFENTDTPMVLVNARQPDLPIIRVNHAFEQVTGYTAEEVIGRNCRFLHRGDANQPGLTQLRQALAAQQACQVMIRNYRKDGALFWNMLHITPLRDDDGQVTYFLGVQHDITSSKHIQEANAAFLADMKALQQIQLELSEIDDLQQIYRRAVEMAMARLGYERIGLFLLDDSERYISGTYGVDLAGNLRDERYYHEAISDEHWTHDVKCAKNHVMIWQDAPLMDNAQLVGRGWKAASTLWNGKRPIGFLVIDNHITHKPPRLYEMELLSILGNTFGQLIERKRVRQRLIDIHLERERVQLLAHFIENAAHEFRTPLATINSSAYLLARIEEPERRLAKSRQIENQVERLIRLVDMLLETAKLERTDPLIMEPVDLNALLTAVCQSQRSRYGDQPMLDIASALDLPVIMADVHYLTSAVRQILDNAYRFTPPEGWIRIDGGFDAMGVWIDIANNGEPIASEDAVRIFDTFWRKDGAHSTPGLGLGLSIARRIADLHGGSLTLCSTPDEITCFRLRLMH